MLNDSLPIKSSPFSSKALSMALAVCSYGVFHQRAEAADIPCPTGSTNPTLTGSNTMGVNPGGCTVDNTSGFTNEGTLTSGTVTNNGFITNDGLSNPGVNGIMTNTNTSTFTNNNYMYNSFGATLKNYGNFTSYYLDNSGYSGGAGSTIINAASGTLTNTYILGNAPGSTITNHGTLNNSTFLSRIINNGTLTSDGALNNGAASNLDNGGNLTNSGVMTNDGLFKNNGNSVLDGTFTNTGTLNNNNYMYNQFGATLINEGTMTSYYLDNSGYSGGPGSSIVNGVSGTLTNTYNLGNAPGSTIDNKGSLTNVSGATLWNNGAMTNSGTLNHNTGSQMYGSGTLTQTAGQLNVNGDLEQGQVNIQGGSLTGSGTIDANVVNSGGTVAPGSSPGTLFIDGDFTQTLAGTLNTEIGGTTAGSEYDVLSITGTAFLGGTLNVDFVDLGSGLFDASLGDIFNILTAETLDGQFDSLVLGALGSSLGWQISYLIDFDGSNDYVQLSVVPSAVPIPAAAWLFGSSLLVLVGVSRRKKG